MSCCFGGDRKKPDVADSSRQQPERSNRSQVASNRSNISKKSMIITDQKMKSKTIFNTEGMTTNEVSTKQVLKKVSFPNYGKQTVRQVRQEDYGRQSKTGSKSHLHAQTSELNFALDDEQGVSNTFDIPHFNYDLSIADKCFFVGKNKQNIMSAIRKQK